VIDRLPGITAKLNRAEKQIEWADSFIPEWTARVKAWGLEAEVDQGQRRYIWTFRQLKPMPPIYPVVCDEIIHHLRSVLDHLACHLVEASGGQVTNTTAWPIERTERDWKRKVERRRRLWQIWRKTGGGPLKGIPIGGPIWTFIEAAQPYRRSREARQDMLFALNDTWNANKHRVLTPDLTYLIAAGDPLDLFDVHPPIQPVESRWLIPRREAKNGTKVALFRFPTSEPLPTMRVKMDAGLSAQIAVGDGKEPTIPFDDLLDLVRQLVTDGAALAPN
jgi:hypothetical protein